MDTFSWDHLTATPSTTQVLDALSTTSLIVFAAMFLVVSVLALWPRRWGLRRRIGRDRYGRWLSVGLWLSSLGLIFLILRFLQIDPLTFARPVWLLVVLAGIAAWLVWLAVMLSVPAPAESYPRQIARRPRKGGSYR